MEYHDSPSMRRARCFLIGPRPLPKVSAIAWAISVIARKEAKAMREWNLMLEEQTKSPMNGGTSQYHSMIKDGRKRLRIILYNNTEHNAMILRSQQKSCLQGPGTPPRVATGGAWARAQVGRHSHLGTAPSACTSSPRFSQGPPCLLKLICRIDQFKIFLGSVGKILTW